MEIIDVSVPIRSGMAHYPGDPDVRLWRQQAIAEGDTANVTELDSGLHAGTHVDAPVHFLEGAEGVEALPLATMLGPADVVNGTSLAANPIDRDALASLTIPEGCERLLLKTRNSELWARDEFVEDFLQLDESGARFVVERGIRLVGLDYMSVGDADAHRALLSSRVVALEWLDLRGVQPGRYELLCLPVKVVGADGGPARVVLRR